jgi:hypothetical protein
MSQSVMSVGVLGSGNVGKTSWINALCKTGSNVHYERSLTTGNSIIVSNFLTNRGNIKVSFDEALHTDYRPGKEFIIILYRVDKPQTLTDALVILRNHKEAGVPCLLVGNQADRVGWESNGNDIAFDSALSNVCGREVLLRAMCLFFDTEVVYTSPPKPSDPYATLRDLCALVGDTLDALDSSKDSSERLRLAQSLNNKVKNMSTTYSQPQVIGGQNKDSVLSIENIMKFMSANK